MRHALALILAMGACAAGSAPVAAQAINSGVPGMIFEHNVTVTMTDGNPLRVNIYRPDKPGRYPVVMLMGPYGKDTHYKDAPAYRLSWKHLMAKYSDLCSKSSCRYMRWEAPDPERWVPDGYIIIHADTRGSGATPGMLDPFSARETDDYATLITWASKQPWSNGKVGLLGTSYYAIDQWQVAARQPEGLAAMIPWEGALDYYREVAFAGGIPNTSWKFWWDNTVVVDQHGNGATPLVDSITGAKPTGEPLSPELLKINRVPPVDTFMAYPLDGAYYHQKTPDPSRIQVPFLDVGNWAGWSIEGYLTAASKEKWLRIQSGDHLTPFYSEEALALQKRFFDHYLKGEDNGWEKEPPVALTIRSPGGVTLRKEASWPLPGTKWERLYLDASSESMGPTGGGKSAAEKSYPARSTGVTFKTAAFPRDIEYTGPAKLKLWVRSTTADMDVFATVRLIDPMGRDVTFQGGTDPWQPLSEGILRVSHRALDPIKSTEYRPYHSHLATEPMVPGQLYEIDIDLRPLSIVVPKGYRLAVTVEGQDWTLDGVQTIRAKDYDLPGAEEGARPTAPGSHPFRDPTLYGGTNTVATGAGHESYLLLPYIPANR